MACYIEFIREFAHLVAIFHTQQPHRRHQSFVRFSFKYVLPNEPIKIEWNQFARFHSPQRVMVEAKNLHETIDMDAIRPTNFQINLVTGSEC